MGDQGGACAQRELREPPGGPAGHRELPLDVAVAAAGIGTFDWDLRTGTLTWDERLVRMFGYEPSAFDPTVAAFDARLHPDDVPQVRARAQEALRTGEPYQDEFRVLLPGGGHRWLAARGRALPDERGTPVRLVGAAWDVTVSHGLRAQSELSGRREQLLSRVSERLGGTQNAEEAVRWLSRLVVPEVADWCTVALIDDDQAAGSRRGARTVASWHADPALRPTAGSYARGQLTAAHDDASVISALRTGEPQVLHGWSAGPARPGGSGSTGDLLADLAPESVAVLPLPGPTGPVGLLTLGNTAERGPLTAEQLATAGAVAERAGLVLANARLYRQQRDLAGGLQRSLLTPPPQSDAVRIAVRYVPAGEAASVGGDWYDAFSQPDGAMALAIGDVVGHDAQAAASMGQIRSTVRTIGAESSDGPADLLARVDRVLATLQAGILATTVVARLEPAGAGGSARLRWSNAGHPPPVTISADGEVRLHDAGRPDLLLGVAPGTPRREQQVTLDRGTVLVLYTDGLIERRDQDLDQGLDRLQRALADLAGRDLEELCDELLARMLPADPEDDVAVIAVRLHAAG